MQFDEKILKFILNPDNFEVPLVRGNETTTKDSVLFSLISGFLKEIDEKYANFFNLCESNFFSTRTYTYPEFN